MDLPFQVATLRWAQKKIKNENKKKTGDNESMTKNLLQLTQREREVQRCFYCYGCHFN